MNEMANVRLTKEELLILRHAVRIGLEDGSLADDIEDVERCNHIDRKLKAALRRFAKIISDGKTDG